VVHIDRLILRGFRDDDRRGIATGLETELARVLADRTVARQLRGLGNVASLAVGNVRRPPEATSRATGVEVARSISKGLAR
jgi:hypothetical protein